MAQIWLTYAELGELTSRSAEAARDEVGAQGYDRRRSHDGMTRVKLPAHLAEAYMMNFVLSRVSKPSPVAEMHTALAKAFQIRQGETLALEAPSADTRRRAA